jgi:hypothetical protein
MARGSAMPHHMADDDIMREHAEAQERVVAEHQTHMVYDHNDDGVEATTDGPHGDREPIFAPTPATAARGNVPFHTFMRLMRENLACPECGKSRGVANVAARGFKPERITAETHCTCVGGPAYAGIGSERA